MVFGIIDADQANWFEGLVDSSLLEDDVPSQSFCVPWVRGKGAGRKVINIINTN